MALTNQLYHTGIKIGEDAQTQIDFETANEIHFDADNAERIKIDSTGLHVLDGNGLVVGHTSQVTTSMTAEAQVLGTATADSSLTLGLWNTTNSQLPRMQFLKSGSGTIGSNTIVADGESLGMIEWYADDGTDYASRSAYIIGEIDGGTGTNDVPGRLIFGTTADGANNPTEALRIDSSQNATFAGNITVSEDGKIDFSNTAPGTSGDATGVIFSFTAGTTLAVGDVVYMGTGGKVLLADADAATSMPALGICTSASTDTNPVDVMVQGVMKLTGWSFTIGNDIFVSTTAGDVTATAPSGTGDTVQKVGVATASDAAYFNFNTTEVVLA